MINEISIENFLEKQRIASKMFDIKQKEIRKSQQKLVENSIDSLLDDQIEFFNNKNELETIALINKLYANPSMTDDIISTIYETIENREAIAEDEEDFATFFSKHFLKPKRPIDALSGFSDLDKSNRFSTESVLNQIFANTFDKKSEDIEKIVKHVFGNQKFKRLDKIEREKVIELFETQLQLGKNIYLSSVLLLIINIIGLIEGEKLKNHILLENDILKRKNLKRINVEEEDSLISISKKYFKNSKAIVKTMDIIDKRNKRHILTIDILSQKIRTDESTSKIIHNIKYHVSRKFIIYWLYVYREELPDKEVSLSTTFLSEDFNNVRRKSTKNRKIGIIDNYLEKQDSSVVLYKDEKYFDEFYEARSESLHGYFESKRIVFNFNLFERLDWHIEKMIQTFFVDFAHVDYLAKINKLEALREAVDKIKSKQKKKLPKQFSETYVRKFFVYIKKYNFFFSKKGKYNAIKKGFNTHNAM